MVKGVHVPARITHPVTVREFETLKDYQAGVGGMIEAVEIELLDATMYVNEECSLQLLELNSRATFVRWYHVRESRSLPTLVGDVVIVGKADDDGNCTDLLPVLIALFTQPGDFHLEAQADAGHEWRRIVGIPDFEDYFTALTWGMIVQERLEPYQLKVVGSVEGPGSGPLAHRTDPNRK